MYDNNEQPVMNIPINYHAAGIVNSPLKGTKFPIHICNSIGNFNLVMDNLNNKIKEFEDADKLHIVKEITPLVTNATNEGIVL